MQNINPSNNVNRRARFYIAMGIMTFMGGLILAALGLLFFVLPLLGDSLSTPAGVCFVFIGLIVFGVGLAGAIRGFTLQKDNPIAYEVGEYLKQTALGNDARYTFIRNISKRHVGYVDAVLVGPPGVLVMRTIAYKGNWINERVEWRHQTRNGTLKKANTNPTRECARDVYTIRKFLAKKRLDKVPVYGLIVFVDDAVELKADAPVIPVTEMQYLFTIMSQDYLQEERINHSLVRATTDAFIE